VQSEIEYTGCHPRSPLFYLSEVHLLLKGRRSWNSGPPVWHQPGEKLRATRSDGQPKLGLGLGYNIIYLFIYLFNSSGFAHLRLSITPVLGHRISCQDIGSIVAPERYRCISVTKIHGASNHLLRLSQILHRGHCAPSWHNSSERHLEKSSRNERG
jgi:hypothetical protein